MRKVRVDREQDRHPHRHDCHCLAHIASGVGRRHRAGRATRGERRATAADRGRQRGDRAHRVVRALRDPRLRARRPPPAGPSRPGEPGDEPSPGGGTGFPDGPPCAEGVTTAGSCDPGAPRQEQPAPEPPAAPEPEAQKTPAAPALEQPEVPQPEAPEAPAVEAPDTGILQVLLAPVHAAAKSASDGARGAITGVVTTAGFVADEVTGQAQDRAAELIDLASGASAMASDLVNALLYTLEYDDPVAFHSETTAQGAEVSRVDGPAQYVTLGLIAVGSLGLIAVGFAVARKLLGLGGIALLSRIPSKDIMKNDTRASIFEIVQSDPGVSLNEIVDRLGLSRNAVAYHLAVFESEKTVVSVKDGKYRRYFVNGGKYVNGAKDVVSTIKNDVTLNVIRYILDHPGVMQKEVCSAVGTSPSATNWHINRLEKVGLVEKAKVANTVRYSPGPSFDKYDLGEFGLAAQTA